MRSTPTERVRLRRHSMFDPFLVFLISRFEASLALRPQLPNRKAVSSCQKLSEECVHGPFSHSQVVIIVRNRAPIHK